MEMGKAEDGTTAGFRKAGAAPGALLSKWRQWSRGEIFTPSLGSWFRWWEAHPREHPREGRQDYPQNISVNKGTT